MILLKSESAYLFLLSSFLLLGACTKINFSEVPVDKTLPSTVTTLSDSKKPTCKFIYEPTQICQANGMQSVTAISKSPSDCVGVPLAMQSCVYMAPTPPTCSYTYTPSQVCQPNGTQSVSVTSTSPTGCVGTPQKIQSCVYMAPTPPTCSYAYTPSQVCQPNGTQSVIVTSISPSGCVGNPQTYQSCVYKAPEACTYTYVPTQVCQTNGTQTVSVASQSPSGCVGTPETIQSCTAPQFKDCPNDQMYSMAQQRCVSVCLGKQAYIIEERNTLNDETAQIPFGYNAFSGIQFILNGTPHQFGQCGAPEGQPLNYLGSMMEKAASYSDFVSAINASISANQALNGRISASVGSVFSFYLYNGVRTTGQEILLSGNGAFSTNSINTFCISPNSIRPPSHQILTKVYCKDQ